MLHILRGQAPRGGEAWRLLAGSGSIWKMAGSVDRVRGGGGSSSIGELA